MDGESLHNIGLDMSHRRVSFPVVGLGASAGGLRALTAFLEALPPQPGMAFVLVQHLAPDHVSELHRLLQSHTGMTVQQVHERVELAPDHVYVIPPGRVLTLRETERGVRLLVSERLTDRERRFPIDRFFRSLAEVQGEDAVCVVFSGTGTDGTLGLKSVKEVAGLCLVQKPAEAEYDGMPRSAMATGLVDVADTVAGLARRVAALAPGEANGALVAGEADLDQQHEDILQSVFIALQRHTGHAFGGYKRATILRRLARRMQVAEIDDFAEYVAYLEDDDGEVWALFKDLLISVTSFFRDREAFAALADRVVPDLFRNRDPDDTIRVWVPGCATGEEAFSIGMLLLEHRERMHGGPDIQVFATDVDSDSLAFARSGSYPGSIATDVSSDRLQRFFSMKRNGYVVAADLMDIVLFAEHNLTSDPPFSKLDLISCRNVLIYMGRALQEEVFARLHYALRDDAYLLLGMSEAPDASSPLFRAVDSRQHIYRPTEVPASATSGFVLNSIPSVPRPAATEKQTARPRGLATVHRSLVINQHAPPSVLVDDNGRIVHVTGDVSPYMRVRDGLASFDLMDMVAPGLRLALRPAFFRAVQGRRTSISWEGSLQEDAGTRVDGRLELMDGPEAPSDVDGLGPGHDTDADVSPSGKGTPGQSVDGSASREPGGDDPPPAILRSLSVLSGPSHPDSKRFDGAAVEEVVAGDREAGDRKIAADAAEGLTRLALIAEPVRDRETDQTYVLLVFDPKTPTEAQASDWRVGRTEAADRRLFESMDEELRETQQQMRTLMEEHETSAEELQTSNEELQSMNEELRSATEELQIRKEELQSANEELLTVNQELKSKISEVNQVNADLENLMAATDIATLFLDRRLRLKRYTPQALSLFDIQANDEGVPVERISHTLVDVDVAAAARTVYDSLKPIRREVTTATGTYLMSVLPYRTPGDRIDGVVVTFVDVTDRVELREQRDKAHEASEMKSKMIANLSHEVRTPMTALLGFSEVLLEEAQSPDARQFGHLIYKSSLRLQNTLESVLHFSRLDAGKESMEREAVRLVDEVRETFYEQRSRARARDVDISLDTELAADDTTCETDPGAIQRILRNLTGNAIKYTPAGGSVVLRCVTGPRGVMIEVEDTGIGMSSAFQQRMFDPFSQESEGHAREFEGVGLGLSIVQKLTNLIGASLEVESSPDQGTRFALLVPRDNGRHG